MVFEGCFMNSTRACTLVLLAHPTLQQSLDSSLYLSQTIEPASSASHDPALPTLIDEIRKLIVALVALLRAPA